MTTHTVSMQPSQVLLLSWTDVGASETNAGTSVNGPRPLAGAVQMEGTFGGTVTLQHSIDGTNYHDVIDLDGAVIALSGAGLKQFTSAATWFRVVSGAGVSNVTVLVAFRG